ncbi:hypothetical protein [Enterocloster asparagiformis]|uniref:Uncharacterized protein n=1 Tax=[Clostridium] asparagiforme DSM 15981 TaxID=518636 RepID=C0CVA3_9FIRM|nr:hypothetical protein [Enterocloster asparagiformis]EEG56989.1 hypothetical protein CLOSTASPAR_00904 [[Clostridium] asparagiforme DSM 15981]UWO77454.1 hypothetical protein NQ535_03970 [[Clostridium] asparagiforme DSM 15981]
MKKRLKRKIEKRRRAEVHRVLDLVLDINGIEARREEVTGNLPTAFLRFSGHVSGLYVSVHEKGWQAYSSPDYTADIYIDQKHLRQMITDLEVMKRVLSV